MKKIILLVLSLALIPVILLGCQPNDNNQLSSDSNQLLDAEISGVRIFIANGFGKNNADHLVVIYENHDVKEAFDIFSSLISKTVKQEGIVDMVKPEYDLEIIYANGDRQVYHLWLCEKGERSTLMKVDDTHTIYTVSEEMTNKLLDLLDL